MHFSYHLMSNGYVTVIDWLIELWFYVPLVTKYVIFEMEKTKRNKSMHSLIKRNVLHAK